MILVCPDCHRSYVHDDETVDARGGPSSFNCDDCGQVLKTMADAMGLHISSASSRAEMTLDPNEATGAASGQGRVGTLDMMASDAMANATLDMESSAAGLPDMSGATSPSVDAMGGAPPGQIVLGNASAGAGDSQSSQFVLPNAEPSKPRLSARITGQHTAVNAQGVPVTAAAAQEDSKNAPTAVEMPATSNADLMAATAPAQPAFQRADPAETIAPARARKKPQAASGGTGFGLALGCIVILLLIVLIGAGVVVAVYFVGGAEASNNVEPEQVDAIVTKPKKAPLEDRLREAAASIPNAAVPTVRLGSPAQDGQIVLVAPSAVSYNGDAIASVSVGRVEQNSKPSPDSPIVLPLTRAIEKSWAEEFSSELDTDNADRWVVVLADGKVNYRVVYEVLYTGWERGARIQLASTSPMNPNAFEAVEIFPYEWPNPDHVGAPDDLPRRSPAQMIDKSAPSMAVKITPRGFMIWGPKDGPNEATFLEKLNSYPISALQGAVAKLRKRHKITAMRIRATEDVTTFALLQTIAAATSKSGDTPRINELRLSAPEER